MTSVKSETLAAFSLTIIEVPYDYGTIQEAINNAKPGDTIYVYNGTYKEHLEVNKSISLIGQNPNITIIDGSYMGTVVYISTVNVNFTGFTLRNAERGMHLYSCSSCVVETNIITDNLFDGIKVELSRNVTIRNNNIGKNSQNCIYLLNSNNNLIYSNNITCDSRWSQGILIYHSSANVIDRNSVIGTAPQGNEGGIGLLYSHNNSISKNFIIHNNWCGLSLRYSNSTFVWCNTIVGHTWFGMRLTYSYENSIFCNNFVDNHDQVSVESANATWSSFGLGNYWSDYIGFDSQPDGIGDTPYTIDDINIDDFPLMGQFSDFTVFNELSEVIHVSTVSNSTISDFMFIAGQNVSLIKFIVTGDLGGIGFCRISIPHALLQGPYVVSVDDSPPIMIREITSNLTHTVLYFTYYNSNQVTIVPELSSPSFLFLFMLISLRVALIKTKKPKRIEK